MKTVAFLPAHPAQIRLMQPLAAQVSQFADVLWVIRDKDCSLQLADAAGIQYTCISKSASGFIGNGIELLLNVFRCSRIAMKSRVDLWVTKYGCAHMARRIVGGRSLAFNDDDADIVPFVAWTSYPFADVVSVTSFTRMGRFESKAIRFNSYCELFYLHPNRFTPDAAIRAELGVGVDQPYAIVRLSSLRAHHDKGIRGLSVNLLRRVIRLAADRVRIFITSEKPLDPEFEGLRYPLSPDRILHALAFAEFFLGDSQTMTSEAALLGTPAFRINDFVGRISYLADLEREGLSFGFKPEQADELIAKLADYLETPNRKAVFQVRRQQLLAKRVDPVPWHSLLIRMLLGDHEIEEIFADMNVKPVLRQVPCGARR